MCRPCEKIRKDLQNLREKVLSLHLVCGCPNGRNRAIFCYYFVTDTNKNLRKLLNHSLLNVVLVECHEPPEAAAKRLSFCPNILKIN